MNLPDLTDDAVIELAREGGIAWMPALSGIRKIEVAKLSDRQKQRLIAILRLLLPLGIPPGQPASPGGGDRRFFRLQIVGIRPGGDLLLLFPEENAPPSLVGLWRDGEEYGGD